MNINVISNHTIYITSYKHITEHIQKNAHFWQEVEKLRYIVNS